MSREYITKTSDPFEAQKEIARERERCLIEEIIRLKIKCGEQITHENLCGDWGDSPNVFYIGGKRGKDGKFYDADGNPRNDIKSTRG